MGWPFSLTRWKGLASRQSDPAQDQKKRQSKGKFEPRQAEGVRDGQDAGAGYRQVGWRGEGREAVGHLAPLFWVRSPSDIELNANITPNGRV